MALSLQGRTAVLVIDEAQNLPMPVMEQIRLLSNLETCKSKLLQIVLAGQLGLREMLTAPELSQLAQRVSVRYTLQPLSVDEIGRYIDHRLRIAGSEGDIVFERSAIERIHHYSEGVPRLVNLLADRTLLAGYAQRSHSLTAETVERAAETLDLTQPGATPPVERAPSAQVAIQAAARRSRPTLAVLALASVVALAGYWVGFGSGSGEPTMVPPRAEAATTLPDPRAGANPGVAGETVPAEEFTIYVSSFRTADEGPLTTLREQLRAAGYETHLIGAAVPGQGRLYRLVVGSFDDRAAARTQASRLREALGVSHAEVVSVADVTRS